jgi:hypothetical protein
MNENLEHHVQQSSMVSDVPLVTRADDDGIATLSLMMPASVWSSCEEKVGASAPTMI